MSKNLKIEIRPVFRIVAELPSNLTIGELFSKVHKHKGDIARQPARLAADGDVSLWAVAIDFDQPASRLEFIEDVWSSFNIQNPIRYVLLECNVPTTIRS